MSYRFYPYHWARKQRWPLLAMLEDADPLFANFLRAGAARVRYHQALIDEIRTAKGEDAVPGIGVIDVETDSTTVTGHGTEFTDDDEQREFLVGGVTYLVAQVSSPEALELSRPYEGVTATGLPYSLGVKLVGSSWQVRIPTALTTLRPEAL